MEAIDAAYMAGLFDGEGSVDYKQRMERKKKHKGEGMRETLVWNITCEMAMTDEDTVRWFHKKVGTGRVNMLDKSKQAGGKPHHKMQWRWRTSHREALKFAKSLIPYAKTKKEKLRKIINHYETSL